MRAIDADAIPEEFMDYVFDGKWTGCTIKDLIDSQPTVQPEPHSGRRVYQAGYADGFEAGRKAGAHWIPCSERLPEANGRYLVTRGLNACGSLWNRIYIVNYSDLMGLKRERIWWQGNVGKSDFERIDDVLAWMPLPECYREGEG